MRIFSLKKISGIGIEMSDSDSNPKPLGSEFFFDQHESLQLFDRVKLRWYLQPQQSKHLEAQQLAHLHAMNNTKTRGTLQSKTKVQFTLRVQQNGIPGKLGYGRLYGSTGALGYLRTDIQASLCSKFYTDVDMKNCHPTLIHQMATRLYKLDMPRLRHYCGNVMDYYTTYGKENVKNWMYKTLYDGAIGEDWPPILMEIHQEIKRFIGVLKSDEKHAELLDYSKRQKKSVDGNFLHYVITREERYCLGHLVKCATALGFLVDDLNYDGCKFRKHRTSTDEWIDNVTPEILSRCEDAVLEGTGYAVELVIKPMIGMEEEPEEETLIKAYDEAYQTMKTKWETNHFYFRPNNTIVEQGLNGKTMSFSLEHAETAFNMWVLPDNPSVPKVADRQNLFLKRWNGDSERRIIDDYVFKPTSECTKNEISLFKGYHYQTLTPCENPKAIEMFRDILMANCNDDETTYNYMLKWFARMIQNPYQKSATCPIFINKKQGTGKDTICLWMKKLMGNHIGHYQNDEDLFEKHDTRKEGAVMMYLEEVGSGVCKSKATALKAMITSDSMSINPKCEKGYSVPNVGNFIMTTNNENPVKIENSDRRFFPIETSSRLLGKHEYWKEFYTTVKFDMGPGNPEWLYPVGKYLESIDLTSFNPRDLPENECKNEIVEATVPAIELFLKEWSSSEVEKPQFYSDFATYCQSNHLSMGCKADAQSFVLRLRQYKHLFGKRESNGKTWYWGLVRPSVGA